MDKLAFRLLGFALLASGLIAACGDDTSTTTTGPSTGSGTPACGNLAECDGACVDTALDPANCGDCGTACGAGEVCSAGSCAVSCSSGATNCSGSCIDTTIDPNNCGACGTACAAGEVCTNGTCALSCGGGTTECSGLCVDTDLDPANCGSCGNACGTGEVCSGGTCGLSCSGGTTLCGSVCVDTNLDPAHCGGCSSPCGSGEVCSNGSCALTCTGGTTLCGSVCVDTDVDPAHCGGCSAPCASGEVCSNGSCALSCSGGTTLCGGNCVDTTVDPAHCGGCNAPCSSGQVCVNGGCALQCPSGQTDCSGSCKDTNNDPQFCGSCTNACASTEACVSGTCAPLAVFASCAAIKTTFPSSGDGVYTIDPDGPGGNAPFQAYCDMTLHNGGWTRCLEFVNTAADDYGTNNTWLNTCMDWTSDSWTGNDVLFVVKDTNSAVAYAEFGTRTIAWTQAKATCPNCADNEHYKVELHTTLVLGNTDEVMISGNVGSNSGCIGDIGSGYSVTVYPANPPPFPSNTSPRLLVMSYQRPGGGARALGSGNNNWFQDNEISYDGTTGWSTCGFPPAHLGSFEMYVR